MPDSFLRLERLKKFVTLLTCALFILMASPSPTVAQNKSVQTDFCVYGGTSGGVIAAVQAARLGKTVALVAVNNHLGGMTSGGLGETDIGSLGSDYIQGMAREFYERVGRKYGEKVKFHFEPHVAESLFNDMVREAHVQLYTKQYLVNVSPQADHSLTAITMNNGNVFRARMFIDASYEGDLMARAGVSFVIGREASTQYGESLNGVRPPNSGGHQFGSVKISPWLLTNNPGDGLVALIQQDQVQVPGSADAHVQAYNFRICLTQNPTNRLPITAPLIYRPAQYELLARYVQGLMAQHRTVSLTTFMGIYPMPNGKTDINNNGPISTDFIGRSDRYALADPDSRAQIWKAHKDYTQGLFWFLATDPRVPETVRRQMQSYGLCRDEFADNGGWPYQLYVREARRMISDYVLTQSNCLGLVTAPDSIGLAAYAMDSHNCQRVVVDGVVENEGDSYTLGAITNCWPVAYRAIVPKKGQCGNLLVPWCLSASHVAFGSFRMEPVFMIVSQSAAIAGCLALDEHVPVQQIDYAHLRTELLAHHQRLAAR
jgi:hypothetical protein